MIPNRSYIWSSHGSHRLVYRNNDDNRANGEKRSSRPKYPLRERKIRLDICHTHIRKPDVARWTGHACQISVVNSQHISGRNAISRWAIANLSTMKEKNKSLIEQKDKNISSPQISTFKHVVALSQGNYMDLRGNKTAYISSFFVDTYELYAMLDRSKDIYSCD